jgi:hypothetical protein
MQAVELLKDVSVLPDMELDPWAARWQGFDNCNGLNPDPVAEVRGGQAWMCVCVCAFVCLRQGSTTRPGPGKN